MYLLAHALHKLLTRIRPALLSAAVAVVPIPFGWPHHLALGVSDSPGDATQLAHHAPFDVRYQYLAGGVNTGNGWAHWNPGGSFASGYVNESIAAHMIPVLTYYQLLQSRPSRGSDELHRDLSNLRNRATMRSYWADWSLLLRRVGVAAAHHLVVIHVEPDLWGYLEQSREVALARAFAHRLIALRDRLAPHVLLAWHLSAWGSGDDADASAAFYQALHAHFDLVFNDIADRDAGFYRVIEGKPNLLWKPADYARHDAYLSRFTGLTHTAVVLWQLPLGNMGLGNTWGHFRDNRVQWWLGDRSRAHLRATRASGVIGLLFGGGAAGTTSPQTDGGLFYRLGRRYLAAPLALP